MLRHCYMGLGSFPLQPGQRTWRGAESLWKPEQGPFRADKVVLGIEGRRDFSIVLHGWRVGKLGVRWDAFPPVFSRGSGMVELDPGRQRGGVYIMPGQAIELELENTGQHAVMARVGLMGTADLPEGGGEHVRQGG